MVTGQNAYNGNCKATKGPAEGNPRGLRETTGRDGV